MTLPVSGTIGLSQVNSELGFSSTAFISLGDTVVRTLAQVASGLIALSNLYGKSNAATGKGYFAGGTYIGADYLLSGEIDGIDFSTEAAINPSAVLSLARDDVAGVNSSTKGYFGGGYDSRPVGSDAVYSEIDGIDFSTEAAINPSAVLSRGLNSSTGVNSTTKGYFGGGYFNAGMTAGFSSRIETINFSTEASSYLAAVLVVGREGTAGVNSTTKGYFAGGMSGNLYPGVFNNEIDGIDFSTEAAINPSAVLSLARAWMAGVNSTTKGYFAGGLFSFLYSISDIDGIDFSTEAAINPSAVLNTTRDSPAGVNSSAKGYFGGGHDSPQNHLYYSEIDGINFSTEAAINPSAVLTRGRKGAAGVQTNNL